MTIIEIKDNRLVIGGHPLPKGDVDILKHLLREGQATAFQLMQLTGKLYVQYIQYRLRVLSGSPLNIIIKGEVRGIYEINPEIKSELETALRTLGEI